MTQSFTHDSLLKYGKENGYSDREIKKVLDSAKYSLVNTGINSGYTGSEINTVLNKAGYDNYNPLRAKAN